MREIKKKEIEKCIKNAIFNEDRSVVEILCGGSAKVSMQRLVSGKKKYKHYHLPLQVSAHHDQLHVEVDLLLCRTLAPGLHNPSAGIQPTVNQPSEEALFLGLD